MFRWNQNSKIHGQNCKLEGCFGVCTTFPGCVPNKVGTPSDEWSKAVSQMPKGLKHQSSKAQGHWLISNPPKHQKLPGLAIPITPHATAPGHPRYTRHATSSGSQSPQRRSQQRGGRDCCGNHQKDRLGTWFRIGLSIQILGL